MNRIDEIRRRLLQLAAAAPSLALAAWPVPMERHDVCSTGKYRFFSAPDGIHWASSDGESGGLLLPLGMSYALTAGSLSPGMRHLAYTALDRRTGSSIWVVPIHWRADKPLAGTPVRFFHSGAFDVNPRFSADGQRIAWASLKAGHWHHREREFASA